MQVVAAVGRVLVKAPRGQLVVAAADLAQVAQRRQRHGAHIDRALFAQRHDGDGFVLARLGKRVLERRPGVAHGRAADLLRAVQVAERHVVKRCEHAAVHIVRPADGQFLRAAARPAGHELVRHEHVARSRIDVHVRDGFGHGVGVALDLRVREPAAHVRGLQKRQQPYGYGAEFVAQHDGRDRAAVDRRDVDAAAVHDPPAEGEPLRRVVVAADEQHWHAARAQLGQKSVEQLDGLGRRHGLVVHVARNQHAVRPLIVQNGEDLPQNICLIFQHRKAVDPLAEMQVGEVKKFHIGPLLPAAGPRCGASIIIRIAPRHNGDFRANLTKPGAYKSPRPRSGKASQSLRPQAANRISIIFSGDMCGGENTARPANVRAWRVRCSGPRFFQTRAQRSGSRLRHTQKPGAITAPGSCSCARDMPPAPPARARRGLPYAPPPCARRRAHR